MKLRASSWICAAVLMGAAGLRSANADSYHVGSLDGQYGWNGGIGTFTNNDAGDEAVTTAAAHTGTQSWRYSAGYGSPGQGTPYSPQLTASAGLSGSGTALVATADTMSISLWFKPVGALGDGSNENIYEGTDARNDRTGSNIYLTSTTIGSTPGIELRTFDANLGYQPIAFLTDTAWHEVTMTTTSAGTNSADERTTFSVDGGAPVTFTPWADLSRDPGPYPSAASVKFVNSNAHAPSTTGFYYDDLSYSVYNSSDPSTVLASYSTSFEAAAVPLPKSAWGGLALIGAMGLVTGAKRFRRQLAL